MKLCGGKRMGVRKDWSSPWKKGAGNLGLGKLAKASLIAVAIGLFLSGCSLDEAADRIPENISDRIASLFAMEETLEYEAPSGQTEGENDWPVKSFASGKEGEESREGEGDAYSFDRRLPLLFAYERLSESEKIWYRAMNHILSVMGTEVDLPREGLEAGLDETSLEKIFQCVLDDHPEYFYVEGYNYVRVTYGDVLNRIEFSGTYSMDLETAKQREAKIKEAADNLLAGIRGTQDDYLRVKYLYERIILQTEYDLNARDNQNIYSVLIGGRSVCQGYAKTLQYLLGELGMEATLVSGSVENGELHAWNLVKVDGEYYYVDATWGDTSYEAEQGLVGEGINYEYLCVTTRALEDTHTIQTRVDMPLCTSMEANYYVREGMYAESFDKEWIQAVFDRAASEGRNTVWIKCANQGLYEEMKDWLIRKQRIFDYLPNQGNSLSYGQSDRGLLLTFWVRNS